MFGVFNSITRPSCLPLVDGFFDLFRRHFIIVGQLTAGAFVVFCAILGEVVAVVKKHALPAVKPKPFIIPFEGAFARGFDSVFGRSILANLHAYLSFPPRCFDTIAAIIIGMVTVSVCGRGKGEQQASGNKRFHGAPFCFEPNLRTTFRQYNLG